MEAASSAAIVSVILEYRNTKQFSPVAFCSGAIIGLVAITPGSGFVGPLASIVFGSSAAIICHLLMQIKYFVAVDDATDVFIVHAVAGLLGNILTGIFAQSEIASLDGTVINGGWVNGNWMQVPYQLAGSFAAMGWSFALSLVILKILDKIPGLKLRVETSSELEGLDKVDLGVTIFPSPI
ncbi:unnamed protein product [Orchesella dallaii]|uniref:Ammonium transporter AmtB-like domain-containing protein n=1 Tax=Orchesella dallaii TaxID=48710 RepID=A0ABP1RFE4_9HEXA